MKYVRYAFATLATCLMVLAGARLSIATIRIMSGPEPYSGSGSLGRHLADVRILPTTAEDTVLDLGNLDRTLLLLFDPDCGPCNANMANWIDLLSQTRSARTGVIALGLRATDPDQYWEVFEGRIPVYTADSTNITRAGFRATPTTMLILNGRVTHEFVGVLNERERLILTDAMQKLATSRTRPVKGR